MKNLLLYLLISCLSICYSQCPDSNILLSTQAEIDDFAANYPGCTSLNVDITISGSDINDLSGLSQIIAINGTFLLLGNNSLTTMDGLSTINFFGANTRLAIDSNSSLVTISNFTGSLNSNDFSNLSIQNNENLTSISGLSGITNSKSINISYNDSLTNLSGVENMSISGNGLNISVMSH